MDILQKRRKIQQTLVPGTSVINALPNGRETGKGTIRDVIVSLTCVNIYELCVVRPDRSHSEEGSKADN